MENDLDKKIEKAIYDKTLKENNLAQKEEKLFKLDAHTKTMLSAILKLTVPLYFPNIQSSQSFLKIIHHEKYPLFVFNLGPFSLKNSENGVSYPESLRVMRIFEGKTKMQNKNIIYTTTISKRGNNCIWQIKDSDNNLLRGSANIFEEFKKWFDFELPFQSIDQWIELEKLKNLK